MVAWLRRLGMPPARIQRVCAAAETDRSDAAHSIAEYWQQVETDTAARRELADFLIAELSATRSVTTQATLSGPPACRESSISSCTAVSGSAAAASAVHTYDAQLTVGDPQPLPQEVALDGVEDFLFTCCATTSPWPHEPAVVDYHVTEGRYWRLWLFADGERAARLPTSGAAPTAAASEGDSDAVDSSAQGTASDFVPVLYDRIPVDSLKLEGDRRVIDRLAAWDPDA